MPRPRRLADEDVLDCAVEVFRQRGYAGASLRDLTQATGLSAASLYNRYGDKDGLFISAVNRYADMGISERLVRFALAPSPQIAIKQFFEEIISLSDKDSHHLGCLLVNSLLDGGAMSNEARKLIHLRLFEVETFFTAQLERAKMTGLLSADKDAAAIAEYLTATVLSLRVLARVSGDTAQMRRISDQALSILQN